MKTSEKDEYCHLLETSFTKATDNHSKTLIFASKTRSFLTAQFMFVQKIDNWSTHVGQSRRDKWQSYQKNSEWNMDDSNYFDRMKRQRYNASNFVILNEHVQHLYIHVHMHEYLSNVSHLMNEIKNDVPINIFSTQFD